MRCAACGETSGIQVDHIIPFSRGGTSDVSNLQPLCAGCNYYKHDYMISVEQVRRHRHALAALYSQRLCMSRGEFRRARKAIP